MCFSNRETEQRVDNIEKKEIIGSNVKEEDTLGFPQGQRMGQEELAATET